MKKQKKEITVDKLLEKVPNKYELAIIAGRMAREDLLKGVPKHKIMDDVFDEILKEEFVYE